MDKFKSCPSREEPVSAGYSHREISHFMRGPTRCLSGAVPGVAVPGRGGRAAIPPGARGSLNAKKQRR
jgi:hypothetical protein